MSKTLEQLQKEFAKIQKEIEKEEAKQKLSAQDVEKRKLEDALAYAEIQIKKTRALMNTNFDEALVELRQLEATLVGHGGGVMPQRWWEFSHECYQSDEFGGSW